MNQSRTYVVIILFLVIGSNVWAAPDISCNERARHGRIGAGKALVAIGGCIALRHLFKEAWITSEPLRTGMDAFYTRRREAARFDTVCSCLAAAYLGYMVYTFASESVDSLNIFFDDDEEDAKKDTLV